MRVRIEIEIVIFALLPTVVLAQTKDDRSYYDRNGSFVGSSVTRGNATTFTDRHGRFDGSAIKNSDGTTSLYDRNGKFVGSGTRVHE